MLTSVIQLPNKKWGARKKTAQYMLNSTMHFLVEKSAVTAQLRKKCSVAWCNINLGKEEAKKICINYAQ